VDLTQTVHTDGACGAQYRLQVAPAVSWRAAQRMSLSRATA
jgi:hypothetical protein